jgi:site-specific recombinase XerD
MAMVHPRRNQFSDRPPFCDFLERYQAANKSEWKKSHLVTVRVGIGRFDEWLKHSKIPLEDLTWQSFLSFYRYLAAHGITARAAKTSVHAAKKTIRWGIENGELPQKITDIYTSQYSKNNWNLEIPETAKLYLEEINAVRPKCYRTHLYTLRVFHTFLSDSKLTYRRLQDEDITKLLKYLSDRKLTARGKSQITGGVRSYLRWLHDKNHIRRRPEEIFPSRLMPRKVKTLPRPIEPEIDIKLQQLLRETDDIYYKSIHLIRRTGLRIAELMLLEFDCLQYDIKGRCALKVPAVKLGLERRVPLDPETLEIVKVIQKKSKKNCKKGKEPDRLVIGENGLAPTYSFYSDALTEICARLDAKKWINLHALRHTYATSMLNAGLGLTSLMNILGHKTILMTLGYAKLTQEKVHLDHSLAMKKLNDAQIPLFISEKKGGIDDSFKDIHGFLSKKMDQIESSLGKKKLKGILNRLSKIKSELTKLQ